MRLRRSIGPPANYLHHHLATKTFREIQCRLAVKAGRAGSFDLKVRARVNKDSHYVDVAADDRKHQSRQSILRGVVQLSAAIDQQADHCGMPISSRVHDCRLIMLIARVDIRAAGDQPVDRREVLRADRVSPILRQGVDASRSNRADNSRTSVTSDC
jgi:hypothetical protein